MNYTLETISMAISHKSKALHTPDQTIRHLLTDSRSLSFPEETLFFALIGERNDGHNYIETLFERGVRAFVVSTTQEWEQSFPSASFIYVENTLKSLQELAIKHRSQYNIPIIGITGSNGKTVVKEWLYRLLQDEFHITRSPRSYNSQIGVPLSVWQLDELTDLGIFEAGISQPNEMKSLSAIIQPTIGILTNLGEAHQINFSSLREKCEEKLNLFHSCEILIYNADQTTIKTCVDKFGFHAKHFTWSKQEHQKPTLLILSIDKKEDSSIIHFIYDNQEKKITVPVVEEGYIENAINCLCCILALGIQIEKVKEIFKDLPPLSMRLEVSNGKQNNLLINDSYNSDINSLMIAIDFLNRRALTGNREKTLILSDMNGYASEQSQFYQKIGELLKFHQIDHLIGVGKELMEYQSIFDIPRKEFYRSTKELINSGDLAQLSNEIILLKGSRHFEFEQISRNLSLKIHETTLEVNLDAIAHNLNYYRGMLKPATEIICMVKAFGYGSGSFEIAKTLQENHCDYLAVAVADEGVELRNAGITIPIMVMNPETNNFTELFQYNLEPEVYSIKLLKEMNVAAQREGVKDFPIHLKIDTGMNRLGFRDDELETVIHIIKQNQTLRIRSCFSHLVGSDDEIHDDFTNEQFVRFEKSFNRIKNAFDHKIKGHILNTAGIERFIDHQYDMVRLGIGLYGVTGSKEKHDLRNCSTLKSVILQIHEVDLGETIGYGRRDITQRKSKIATIRIGYADGLNRRLSNGLGKVVVNGVHVPIIGNICMDACMIDVTDVSAKEGDEVELFGDQQSVMQIASWLETIPYEVLTSISSRVKRVYYRE